MLQLQINHQACNGQRSCGKCEEYFPGLFTEHSGKMPIKETDLGLDDDNLIAALDDCPTGALSVAEKKHQKKGPSINR